MAKLPRLSSKAAAKGEIRVTIEKDLARLRKECALLDRRLAKADKQEEQLIANLDALIARIDEGEARRKALRAEQRAANKRERVVSEVYALATDGIEAEKVWKDAYCTAPGDSHWLNKGEDW